MRPAHRARPTTTRVTALLTALTLAASSAPPAGRASPAVAGPPGAPDAPRRLVPLAEGWRFLAGDVAGAESPGFDDRRWQPVRVPHTWNAQDGQDGGGDYRRGVGWYRLRFPLGAEEADRKLFLEFGAASTSAEVWLNGSRLGEHHGAYTAFRLEGTSVMRAGADNLLAVRVTNAFDPLTPPVTADYTFFGGLVRPVQLLTTDRLQVRALDAGGPGLYLTPREVSAASAELDALVKLWNGFPTARRATLRLSVAPQAGEPTLRLERSLDLPPDSGRDVTLSGRLERPRLWRGRADPFVYTARLEVWDGEVLRDVVTQPVGFRTVAADPARGFLLNGEPLKLRGVNRHQDRQDRGWAIGPAEHAEDLRLIHEMGANALRLAHYPQDPLVYDLADRLGLVVWSEIPFVNRAVDTPAFGERARAQLVEMLRQHHNHPSVAFWGLGNEVTQDPSGPDPTALLAELAELARSEDPSRLTAVAHCCTDEAGPATRQSQVVGYNKYFGWYGGKQADLGPWADALHAAHPARPLVLSEYGAGASPEHHEDPAQAPAPGDPFHPEAYQAQVHAASWPVIAGRPYLLGGFVWNMFDFASDGRDEGDRPGRNDKGLVTYDRRVKKDAYWYYRASWSDQPTVYLAGRRHQPRLGPRMDVTVYANTESVTLTVNGRRLGPPVGGGVLRRWPDVPLSPGRNVVVAQGSRGGRVVARDRVIWLREDTVRLDAGARRPVADLAGHGFAADHAVAGGTPRRTDQPVTGTADPQLYQTYRFGTFRYRIPLPAGRWRVTLRFAEPFWSQPAQRVFDVAAEGRTVVAALDLVREVGPLAALDRSFVVPVTDGALDLAFTPRVDQAMVSAIEVTAP
jgi:beta-galactosidase